MKDKIIDLYLIITGYTYFFSVIISLTLLYYVKMSINFVCRKKIFNKEHPFFLVKLIGSSLLYSLGIDVKLNYYENKYPKEKSVIYLFTHASALEGLAFSQFDIYAKSISKKELFRIPIYRDVLNFLGTLPINRQNTEQAIQVLKKIEDELKKGTFFIMSPEGTRRKARSNGKSEVLLPFKKGAFRMAKNVRCSIVPLIFYGSSRILGASSIIAKPRTTLYVDILPEISPEEILKYGHNELREKIFEDIKKNYKNYDDSKIFNGGLGVKYNLMITFSIILICLLVKIIKMLLFK